MPRFDDIRFLKDLSPAYPGVFAKVWPLAEALMRDDAPLTRAERELIAAYVSSLNQCSFCHGVHANVARAYGLEESLIEAMTSDIATAPVDPKLKPILEYARVLTETPSKITDAYYKNVRSAGWDDKALGYAIGVMAFFNMMNRLVEGFDIKLPQDGGARSGRVLAEQGYDRSDN